MQRFRPGPVQSQKKSAPRWDREALCQVLPQVSRHDPIPDPLKTRADDRRG